MPADRPAPTGSIAYQPALDGLRGVAIAGVLLFHAQRLRGGFLGVDVFFVLSGFLITSILLAEHRERGTVRLGSFWGRRARRLLPALACLLLLAAVYSVLVAQHTELETIRGDVFATLAYVANWRQIAVGRDYFALFRAPSVLQHTWSLAIEEQFYLVWPLVVLGLTRALSPRPAARRMFLTAATLAAVSYGWSVLLARTSDTSRMYYGTDTRAGAILLGATFAAWLAWRGPATRRGARVAIEVLALVGIGVLTVAWTHAAGTDALLYRGGFVLCGLSVVAIIAASAHPDRGPVARLLSVRALVVLGLVSYGAYLYHWPIYLMFDHLHVTGLPLLVIKIGATLVAASLSFVFLERPIRRQRVSIHWRAIAPATLLVLVLLTLGATAGATGPPGSSLVRERLDRAVRRAAAAGPDTLRVLLAGDSVGWHLGPGFPPVVHGHPLVVANVSLLACGFPAGLAAVTYEDLQITRTEPPSCDTGWATAVRRFHPHDVVLALWAPGTAVYEYGPDRERPCDPAYRARYRHDLTAVVRSFRGENVAITTYPPSVQDERRPRARRQVDCVNDLRRAVATATGAQLIDVAGWVCPEHRACRTQAGTVVLRPDSVHFSGPGAEVVASWIAARLTGTVP